MSNFDQQGLGAKRQQNVGAPRILQAARAVALLSRRSPPTGSTSTGSRTTAWEWRPGGAPLLVAVAICSRRHHSLFTWLAEGTRSHVGCADRDADAPTPDGPVRKRTERVPGKTELSIWICYATRGRLTRPDGQHPKSFKVARSGNRCGWNRAFADRLN
jgi:hypothetical protein